MDDRFAELAARMRDEAAMSKAAWWAIASQQVNALPRIQTVCETHDSTTEVERVRNIARAVTAGREYARSYWEEQWNRTDGIKHKTCF